MRHSNVSYGKNKNNYQQRNYRIAYDTPPKIVQQQQALANKQQFCINKNWAKNSRIYLLMYICTYILFILMHIYSMYPSVYLLYKAQSE